MTRPDDILDLIDAGLQSSAEAGMPVGEPDACVRCGLTPLVDAELCTPCRAFLLGDSDVDPVEGSRPSCGDPACTQCPRVPVAPVMEDADRWDPPMCGDPTCGNPGCRWSVLEQARVGNQAWVPGPVTMPGVERGDLIMFNGQSFMVTDIRPSATGTTWMLRPVEQPARSPVQAELTTQWVNQRLTEAYGDAMGWRDRMAGLCGLCGEAEHQGPPCPPREWVEPFGIVGVGPPTGEELAAIVRRRERELLAQRRRGQRRTNRLGPRPGR